MTDAGGDGGWFRPVSVIGGCWALLARALVAIFIASDFFRASWYFQCCRWNFVTALWVYSNEMSD